MNTWRWAWQKLRWAARVVWQDLFDEGDLPRSDLAVLTHSSASPAWLDPLRDQLDGLAVELGQLEERQRLLEAERARVEVELAGQDRAIDQALLRGDEGLARRQAHARLELLKQYETLTQHGHDLARLAASTRRILAELREQASQRLAQRAGLADRELEAQLLEHLAEARRELEATRADLERRNANEPLE